MGCSRAGGQEAGRIRIRGGGEVCRRSTKRGTSFVQVGVLSSGEIITTGPSRWSSRFFKDQATGAKITAYTSWLKEHLATDICLEKKGLSVEDLFVDASILQNANLD